MTEGEETVSGRCTTPWGVEDRQLATRLVARDPEALAEAYNQYGGLVFGLARRVLGDAELAEDVTQDVFVSLWEEPERFDPGLGTLRSWLGLLAHRRSVDRVRSESRRARRELIVDRSAGPIDVHDEVDNLLVLANLANRVREALDQLPAEQRDAIVLAYYGGRTYRQAAAELDIPEGTAKSRLRLGLAKMTELLGPSLTSQESIR